MIIKQQRESRASSERAGRSLCMLRPAVDNSIRSHQLYFHPPVLPFLVLRPLPFHLAPHHLISIQHQALVLIPHCLFGAGAFAPSPTSSISVKLHHASSMSVSSTRPGKSEVDTDQAVGAKMMADPDARLLAHPSSMLLTAVPAGTALIRSCRASGPATGLYASARPTFRTASS
jgi:hypothetical protein